MVYSISLGWQHPVHELCMFAELLYVCAIWIRLSISSFEIICWCTSLISVARLCLFSPFLSLGSFFFRLVLIENNFFDLFFHFYYLFAIRFVMCHWKLSVYYRLSPSLIVIFIVFTSISSCISFVAWLCVFLYKVYLIKLLWSSLTHMRKKPTTLAEKS